jgi:YbbR domain-containing protein
MNLLRRLLLENLGLKVVSLMLAFLLWMQIAGQQRVQRSVSVPLEFINMPAELEITNDYPKEVNVVISRPISVRMDERQLAAVIDLSNAEPGVVVVPLTERSIRNVPSGVEIEGIEQRRIRLQMERVRRKTVRVVPEIVGQPAEGYRLREVRAVPSEVLISGAESRLEGVTMAATESIDIQNRSRSFSQTVYLDLPDPALRIENASRVDVYVVIEEERREVRLQLPTRIMPRERRGRVTPRTVRVVLSVPVSFAGEISAADFFAYVSVAEDAEAHLKDVPLAVAIPEELRQVVRVERIEPALATIELSRTP